MVAEKAKATKEVSSNKYKTALEKAIANHETMDRIRKEFNEQFNDMAKNK